MAVYLVDFENVRSEGLKGVENLGKNEKVVIFYSKNADAITFDVHMLLSKSKAEVETYRILRGGHNSLDFQLSTYLGYLVMENCYRDIVIVSEDKGFLCVSSFWEENSEMCNAKIRLCKSINMAEESVATDFEDGLTGKFIEKLSVKKADFGQNQCSTVTKETHKNSKSSVLENKKGSGKNNNKLESENTKPTNTKPTNKKTSPKQKHNNTDTDHETTKKSVKRTVLKNRPVQSVPVTDNNEKITQNPTSKNKIFVAEVKLNITEDVKSIVSGKIDEKNIPLLVETIGKSTGKQHFYRMVVSKFGQELGREIYLLIKGQYANLKRK